MSDSFINDLPSQQREKLRKALIAADWAAANGPLGGVILHLRGRATAARRYANLFLIMLVVTVMVGLGFYLGLPFWQNWADGRETALTETKNGITARKATLLTDRRALILGGTLADGTTTVQGLPDLLPDALIAMPTGTDALLFNAILHNDRLFVFGDDGTALRLTADGTAFEVVRTGTQAPLYTAILHNDRLFVFGEDGTALRLSADGTAFDAVPTGTGAWLGTAILHNDRLFAFGDDGTALRLTADGTAFEAVPTGTQALLFNAILHNDRLFVFGDGGTALRLTADGTAFEAVPTGTQARLYTAILHNDRLFAFGEGGTALATQPRLMGQAKALPLDAGRPGHAAVEAFFDALPDHVRAWKPIDDRRPDLALNFAEHTGLDVVETELDARLAALLNHPLQFLQDNAVMEFQAFLNACRGPAPTEALTTGCLTAWQTEQASGQRSWWETLADQLPPGILLLFLLATLGSLYRYNVRLAGFHQSRADFLTLMTHGRDDDQLRDILAVTQTDAQNLVTLVLAADKVEMGAIKAKLGTAEIELARAMSGAGGGGDS